MAETDFTLCTLNKDRIAYESQAARHVMCLAVVSLLIGQDSELITDASKRCLNAINFTCYVTVNL